VRRILPFTQPLAYAYQFYAFPLGILAARPKAADWVLSNYLQVVYEPTGEAAPVPFAFYLYDYAASPWLETLRLNREWCSRPGSDITGIVRDALASDFYVYLTLNERYVPQRKAYRVRDFPHDVLIRGVDDEQGTFELYGYDHELRFRDSRLPQADLPAAYHETGPGPFYDVPFTLYRYADGGGYTFDPAYLAQGLTEYLDSVNSSRHFQGLRDPWPRVYGMATYDLLAGYLDEYARGAVRYDIRNLQVLWEHKRIMVARLERCVQLAPAVGELVGDYRRVERKAWALRALMLAHRAGRPVRDFGAAAQALLAEIRAAERPLLQRFAAALGG